MIVKIMGKYWDSFIESVKGEGDRITAIVCATYLESALEDFLKKRLCSEAPETALFTGPTAPLGSFSSKIHLAYATGIISDPLRKALDLTRRIRNDFAHSIQCKDFAARVVRDRLSELLGMFDAFLENHRSRVRNVVGRGRKADYILVAAWMYTYLRHTDVPQATQRAMEWAFTQERSAEASLKSKGSEDDTWNDWSEL